MGILRAQSIFLYGQSFAGSTRPQYYATTDQRKVCQNYEAIKQAQVQKRGELPVFPKPQKRSASEVPGTLFDLPT